MGRKKEYDKEQILELATKLFWEKGYKATSISDIVKATGLNKHSMYEEFKNKEGLFKEAIFTYNNKLQKENIALLSKEPLGLKNIENFLLNRICYATSVDTKGCMVINALVEKESIDKENFSLIQKQLNTYENMLFKCLKAAQENGEIIPNRDLRILSKYIANFSSGILVNGKLGQKKEDYLAMLDFLMDSIIG